jgi:hypothetical protein
VIKQKNLKNKINKNKGKNSKKSMERDEQTNK